MIIEISVALAALAFVVLVIFLVLTLIDVRRTLKQANQTLLFVESRVDPLHDEALELIKNTKNITATLSDQLQAVNPLMDTVHEVGTALHDATYEFSQELPRKKLRREEKHTVWSDKLINILELGAHALNVWQQVKKRRR